MSTGLPEVMQPGVPVYRAFFLDWSGRMCRADILRAATDTEAMTMGAALPNVFGVQLWERTRHLASYVPMAAPYKDG